MATGKVNALSLNMREDPDANANVNAILVKDATVDIMLANEDDSWILVSGLSEGQTRIGWSRLVRHHRRHDQSSRRRAFYDRRDKSRFSKRIFHGPGRRRLLLFRSR